MENKVPEIETIQVKYHQEGDGNQISGHNQTLTIKTVDAGGGTYFVIKTKRWAFDDINELIATLRDFQSRSSPAFLAKLK
jgi:hypothetical protein